MHLTLLPVLLLTAESDRCSVLIHLLPGLALFAQRHFPPPSSLAAIRLLNSVSYGGEHSSSTSFWWCLVAPIIFYAAWQAVYWFIVQVCPCSCSVAAFAQAVARITASDESRAAFTFPNMQQHALHL